MRTRFAPTPSGYLHQGNAFSFLLTWLLARSNQGKIFLRIDDIDDQRSQPTYVEDIFRSLEWLGLDWDEGPQGPDDFYRYYSQQKRLGRYESMLENLRQNGHLYACTCSRKDIRERNEKGVYLGFCRERGLDWEAEGSAWRVFTPPPKQWSMPKELGSLASFAPPNRMQDFILRTKRKRPSYQLASLVDDVEYQIDFVVRGLDLWPSTQAQLLLSERLPELNSFREVVFFHHPLIKNKKGEKLSKSAGAASLKGLREQHKHPGVLYREFSDYLHLPIAHSASEILTVFDPKNFSSTFNHPFWLAS